MFRLAAIMVLFVFAMLLTGCSAISDTSPRMPLVQYDHATETGKLFRTQAEVNKLADDHMAAQKAKCPTCWEKLRRAYHLPDNSVEVNVYVVNPHAD